MANEFKVRKALVVEGPSTVNGDQTVNGDLAVTGDITGNQNVDGNMTVQDDLHVVGDAQVDNDAVVNGNTTIHGDLQVDGSFSFAGGSVFPDDSFEVQDNSDATKAMGMDLGLATTGTKSTLRFSQTANRILSFPDASMTVVGTDTTQTLSNKKLIDNVSTVVASGDNSKAIKFDVSGVTTATTRTITVPDSDMTMVGESTTQTLSNKSIDSDSNTLSNIKNADIKSSAAIARSKLANGTAAHVVINDGSGVMSSEAALSNFRGGFGADVSGFSGVVKASAGVFSAAALVDADVDAAAQIARSKLADGTGDHVLINDPSGVMSSEAQLDETRGGTGQSGYAAGDMLYASGTDVLAKRTIGSLGQALKVYESGLPAWEDQQSPDKEIRLYDDWMTDGAGALRWLGTPVGSGASNNTGNTLAEAGHPGVLELVTGTTTSGQAARYLGGVATGAATAGHYVAGGASSQEWLIKTPSSLSDGTDRYTIDFGSFGAQTLGVDAIRIRYTDSSSANWLAETSSASTSTSTDTGVAVAANTWYKLRMDINAAGNEVKFYINGSLVATNTTNIPSVLIAPRCRILKALGTSSRTVYIDYFKFYKRFSSAR